MSAQARGYPAPGYRRSNPRGPRPSTGPSVRFGPQPVGTPANDLARAAKHAKWLRRLGYVGLAAELGLLYYLYRNQDAWTSPAGWEFVKSCPEVNATRGPCAGWQNHGTNSSCFTKQAIAKCLDESNPGTAIGQYAGYMEHTGWLGSTRRYDDRAIFKRIGDVFPLPEFLPEGPLPTEAPPLEVPPQADPFSQPVAPPMPAAPPRPIPYPELPDRVPNPNRSPVEQPSWGPQPVPPERVPTWVFEPSPDGNPNPRSNPYAPPTPQPPGPGEKERKVRFSQQGWYRLFEYIFDTFTESQDFIRSGYDAIPDELRPRCAYYDSQCQAEAIYDNLDDIDVGDWLLNHLENTAEDELIGRANRALADAIGTETWNEYLRYKFLQYQLRHGGPQTSA